MAETLADDGTSSLPRAKARWYLVSTAPRQHSLPLWHLEEQGEGKVWRPSSMKGDFCPLPSTLSASKPNEDDTFKKTPSTSLTY